jgi:hypothetical protein
LTMASTLAFNVASQKSRVALMGRGSSFGIHSTGWRVRHSNQSLTNWDGSSRLSNAVRIAATLAKVDILDG